MGRRSLAAAFVAALLVAGCSAGPAAPATASLVPVATESPLATALPTMESTAAPLWVPSAEPTVAPWWVPSAEPTIDPLLLLPAAPIEVDPYAAATAARAAAVCADGTWSFSAQRSGTCSYHGGVHWWTGNLGPAGPGSH